MLDNTLLKNESCTHVLHIDGLSNSEYFCYQLILVTGFVEEKNCAFNDAIRDKILIQYLSNDGEVYKQTEAKVYNNRFKLLLHLELGKNDIHLQCCGYRLPLTYVYEPLTTSYTVKPLYIVCKDHDGLFQAPEGCDNSILSAQRRIMCGMKLVQSFVAEKINEHGYGRKTFTLESEESCAVFYSSLPVEKAYTMKSFQLWEYFAKEVIASKLYTPNRKFIAFLSCTFWDGKMAVAHAAIGGGGLALFGAGYLYTWPANVDEIYDHFSDQTAVNSWFYTKHGNFRPTIGGCFSMTLGAVCHELGHTFDLGHTSDGIMGRDFSYVDFTFTCCSVDTEDDSRDHKSTRKSRHISYGASKNKTFVQSAENFVQDINIRFSTSQTAVQTCQYESGQNIPNSGSDRVIRNKESSESNNSVGDALCSIIKKNCVSTSDSVCDKTKPTKRQSRCDTEICVEYDSKEILNHTEDDTSPKHKKNRTSSDAGNRYRVSNELSENETKLESIPNESDSEISNLHNLDDREKLEGIAQNDSDNTKVLRVMLDKAEKIYQISNGTVNVKSGFHQNAEYTIKNISTELPPDKEPDIIILPKDRNKASLKCSGSSRNCESNVSVVPNEEFGTVETEIENDLSALSVNVGSQCVKNESDAALVRGEAATDTETNVERRKKKTSHGRSRRTSVYDPHNMVYFTHSCATVLAHHRWFISTVDGDSHDLQFDPVRSIVRSSLDIAVVQLRHDNGFVQYSWEFSENQKKRTFIVPAYDTRKVKTIFVEDIKGNILKGKLL